MMTRIRRTLIAGAAAMLFALSIASAQTATPQPTPAPQQPPAAQGTQGTQGTASTPVEEQDLVLATQIAEQWLALVDQGKFADSWTYTSRYFQTNMPQEKWVQTLTAAQQQLGKAANRQMTGRESRENIQGAPPGQYILVGYATDFERKPGLLETVTFIREDDTWKVIGYSASPKPAAQGAQGQQAPPATDTPQPTPTPPPPVR
jgi:serine/threonine-protein kinase